MGNGSIRISCGNRTGSGSCVLGGNINGFPRGGCVIVIPMGRLALLSCCSCLIWGDGTICMSRGNRTGVPTGVLTGVP